MDLLNRAVAGTSETVSAPGNNLGLPAGVTLSNAYALALKGTDKRGRYHRIFMKYSEEPARVRFGFNFVALLLQAPWFLYRRLYGFFALEFALYFVTKVLERASPVIAVVVLTPILLFQVIVAPALADWLLFMQIRRDIRARAMIYTDAKSFEDSWEDRGSVNTWLIWVVGVLFALGVVAAILIPMMNGGRNHG